MQSLLLVALGGALGSSLRFLASLLVGLWWGATFPLATLSINVAGSTAMGVVVGTLNRLAPAFQTEARLFLAVGLLGGFTTFSAFSLETVALLEHGRLGEALLYVLLSVALCLLGLYLGLILTRIGSS